MASGRARCERRCRHGGERPVGVRFRHQPAARAAAHLVGLGAFGALGQVRPDRSRSGSALPRRPGPRTRRKAQRGFVLNSVHGRDLGARARRNRAAFGRRRSGGGDSGNAALIALAGCGGEPGRAPMARQVSRRSAGRARALDATDERVLALPKGRIRRGRSAGSTLAIVLEEAKMVAAAGRTRTPRPARTWPHSAQMGDDGAQAPGVGQHEGRSPGCDPHAPRVGGRRGPRRHPGRFRASGRTSGPGPPGGRSPAPGDQFQKLLAAAAISAYSCTGARRGHRARPTGSRKTQDRIQRVRNSWLTSRRKASAHRARRRPCAGRAGRQPERARRLRIWPLRAWGRRAFVPGGGIVVGRAKDFLSAPPRDPFWRLAGGLFDGPPRGGSRAGGERPYRDSPRGLSCPIMSGAQITQV